MCLFAAGIFCNQYFWKIALAKIGFKPLMVSKALQYSANLFVSTVLVWLSFSLLYIYIWEPSHGKRSRGRPRKTYIDQLIADTACTYEDLANLMNDRDRWKELLNESRASST